MLRSTAHLQGAGLQAAGFLRDGRRQLWRHARLRVCQRKALQHADEPWVFESVGLASPWMPQHPQPGIRLCFLANHPTDQR